MASTRYWENSLCQQLSSERETHRALAASPWVTSEGAETRRNSMSALWKLCIIYKCNALQWAVHQSVVARDRHTLYGMGVAAVASFK